MNGDYRDGGEEEEEEPPSPSAANGGDAEDGEEEEEEPRLKYQRVAGDLPSILSSDASASIAVAERMVALGTHDGVVHILDFQGNQVKKFAVHTATVNDLSFDVEGEFVGSCSDDGSVVINSLFTDEKAKFEFHRPMKTIALDPGYSKSSARRFVCGGLSGQLFLNMKNWLGYGKQVLHEGEGPIHSVRWRANIVAWANDAGVKVFDMVNNQKIAYIERPKGSPQPELLRPHLVWQDDALLVIGWGTSVKVASFGSTSQGPNGVQKNFAISSKSVDIVASFQTSYFISGIAPYGDALVVLAYIPEDGTEKDFSVAVPSRQGTAQPPEIHIVTWKNDAISTDALPMHGYEHYKAKDYVLAHAPFAGSSYNGGQWAEGDEPSYYIVSPKDIVMAKPRDAEDHIAWLLQHNFHAKALAAVEAGHGKTERLGEVGAKYLDHLIVQRNYAEAASLCPKLLRGSPSAWERWVFHFAHLRQLPVLVPYMPTANPELSDTAYEVALVALASNPSFHKLLLSTVKSWPPKLYSAAPVITAVEQQVNTSSATDFLKEALAELYVINGQYEKAFNIYADLLKPEVFYFIEKYDLYSAVHNKVVNLMVLDSEKAVHLLIQHRDAIPPSQVVEQLLQASKKYDKRRLLYIYLHSLFGVDINAGKEFHDMLVELYADYDPLMLLPFLRTSRHYRLDKANEICAKKGLLKEHVFVLGRMGNAKEALDIIINKMEDMQEAIEFVTEQHDADLWEVMIKQCLQKPEMVGMLLEHIVGNLDPLYIVSMVPTGIEIPRLRDRLVKIVTDYRTETSLREGCNEILKADSVNLLVKYFNEARRGVYIGSTTDEAARKKDGEAFARGNIEKMPSARTLLLKSRTRAGGNCCLCFDPLQLRDNSVIVFFCCHGYHLPCLEDGLDSMNAASAKMRGSDSEEEYDAVESPPAESRLRCVLCTTAAV